MKRLKIVLLILGIVFFAAGVWKQDEASLVGLIISVNVIEKSQGAPSWADINSGRELVRGREETGFILKPFKFHRNCFSKRLLNNYILT